MTDALVSVQGDSLRPYQVEAVDFLLDWKRVILGDQMGLGKTIEVLAAVREILKSDPMAKILICGTKNAVFTWIDKWPIWLPNHTPPVHIRGTKVFRKDLWRSQVCVCTFAILRADAISFPQVWDIVIIDEAHKSGIRNRKTQFFKVAKTLQTEYYWLVTGTPASRGAQDFWPQLNILDRKRFTSFWRFVNHFCVVVDGPFAKEIIGTINLKELGQTLSKYMIRRHKTEVRPDLPSKIRSFQKVDMDAKQAQLYRTIKEDMLLLLSDDSILLTIGTLTQTLRLRQLLVCPKLLDPALPIGAGMEHIVDTLIDGDPDEQHCVIYTPFPSAFPFLHDYLIEKGFDTETIIELRGGLEPEQIKARLDLFKDTKGIALVSIKFAQSFDLDSSSYGWFLGYEWDPNENYQAEDRQHRFTTTETVNYTYIVHNNTPEADERVLEVLDGKQQNITAVFNSVQFWKDSL